LSRSPRGCSPGGHPSRTASPQRWSIARSDEAVTRGGEGVGQVVKERCVRAVPLERRQVPALVVADAGDIIGQRGLPGAGVVRVVGLIRLFVDI
jgi:hypothetical protein